MRARVIDVLWDDNAEDRTYESNIMILGQDRNFLLTDIVAVTAQCKAPIESVSAKVDYEKLTSTIHLTLRVHDLEHVKNVIANIHKIEGIISVERSIK